MSYPPDPNNPYGQPPAAPGYGYPQQAPPPPAGYGYPQAAPAYGYAPAVPPSMPGLVTTARVLLFIVGGVQAILAIIYVIIGAAAKDATNTLSRTTSSDNPFTAMGNAAAGVLIVVAVLFGLFAALSITLGAKFGKGGNTVRVITIVYGSLGALVGLLILLGAISGGTAVGLVMAFLWLAISVIWITAMCVRDGVSWFNRPRY
ncbi:hypothetical protein [Streptomyces sp. NRRL S-350]|uniref:hypothetical protein n=1 Tax=Streptomyces sp. NRRL S-350 TaxID=1463902 RepID=UPI0004BEF374|nr:hypothetical protein [Streptomyces sp. NRRL S-350]